MPFQLISLYRHHRVADAPTAISRRHREMLPPPDDESISRSAGIAAKEAMRLGAAAGR